MVAEEIKKPVSSYIAPTYAKKPELISNRVNHVTQAQFIEKYGLYNDDLASKRICIGTHCTEKGRKMV